MNEVKRIHIGRQAFVIAVDAYESLKKYLDALAKHTDAEVVEEVELRMVELLAERKIAADKVILPTDVAYLIENLGQPSDFDDDGSTKQSKQKELLPRRFMRDSRGQILGGVANGLSVYFNVDPLWFRIGFIILTFMSGFGILLYLVLWAIMPVAKTSSDYLQMHGKPVTIESLTEFVENPQLKNSLQRVGTVIVSLAKTGLVILLVLLGAGLTTLGVIGILSSIAGTAYLTAASESLFNGVRIFPLGSLEVATLVLMGLVGLIASIFLLFSGMAIFAKRWQLPGWATASLATAFFVALFTAIPLFAAIMPKVEKRIEDARTSQVHKVAPFNELDIRGDESRITYKVSNEYKIEVHGFGKKEKLNPSFAVRDQKLTVDTRLISHANECTFICFYNELPQIVVSAPSITKVSLEGSASLNIPEGLESDKLAVEADPLASFSLSGSYIETLQYGVGTSGKRTLELSNLAISSGSQYLIIGFGVATLDTNNVRFIELLDDGRLCKYYDPLIRINNFPESITVGNTTIKSTDQLTALQNQNGIPTAFNCIIME